MNFVLRSKQLRWSDLCKRLQVLTKIDLILENLKKKWGASVAITIIQRTRSKSCSNIIENGFGDVWQFWSVYISICAFRHCFIHGFLHCIITFFPCSMYGVRVSLFAILSKNKCSHFSRFWIPLVRSQRSNGREPKRFPLQRWLVSCFSTCFQTCKSPSTTKPIRWRLIAMSLRQPKWLTP